MSVMTFSINFDHPPALVVDGEEKGRVLALEVSAEEDGLKITEMVVRQRTGFGADAVPPFHLDYETITGKKPPRVPVHPRIKVV